MDKWSMEMNHLKMDKYRIEVIKINRVDTKYNKLVSINKGRVCCKMITSEYIPSLEKLLSEKLSQFF